MQLVYGTASVAGGIVLKLYDPIRVPVLKADKFRVVEKTLEIVKPEAFPEFDEMAELAISEGLRGIGFASVCSRDIVGIDDVAEKRPKDSRKSPGESPFLRYPY